MYCKLIYIISQTFPPLQLADNTESIFAFLLWWGEKKDQDRAVLASVFLNVRRMDLDSGNQVCLWPCRLQLGAGFGVWCRPWLPLRTLCWRAGGGLDGQLSEGDPPPKRQQWKQRREVKPDEASQHGPQEQVHQGYMRNSWKEFRKPEMKRTNESAFSTWRKYIFHSIHRLNIKRGGQEPDRKLGA